MKSLRTYAAELRTAATFLTIVPIKSQPASASETSLGQSAGWFAWVGLAIGAATAAAWWLGGLVLPPLLSAVLAVATWVVVTGGLHLDGLADCCDGLLSAAPSERRLEILRDPRLGTFGATGLILVLMAKTAAVYSLPPSRVFPAVLLAGCTARGLILLARWQPSARPGGMGESFTSGLRQASLPLAALPLVATGLYLGWTGWLAVLAALLTTLAVFSLARSRIGGVTGDVLGCAVELGELAAMVICCLKLPG